MEYPKFNHDGAEEFRPMKRAITSRLRDTTVAAERSALWARISLCERLAADPKHANDSVRFQGQVVAYRLQDGEVVVHAEDDATVLQMLKKLGLSTNDVFIDRFMNRPQDRVH